MHPETNLTMGRVLARAWSDPEFKTRLLAGPKAALRELGIGLPDGLDIVARENSAKTVHLAISAPPVALPISACSDIRDFAETYRDPRLWPLNWIARDPPATARLVADPMGELGRLGVHPPKGLAVVMLANTAAARAPDPAAQAARTALHATPLRAAGGGTRTGGIALRSPARSRSLQRPDRHSLRRGGMTR